jgi:hypothetical protein
MNPWGTLIQTIAITLRMLGEMTRGTREKSQQSGVTEADKEKFLEGGRSHSAHA